MGTVEPGSMALGARKGVGDDVAYLRPRYPATDWRLHANFGELAHFWLHVHSSLRSEGSDVLRIVDAFRGDQIDPIQLQQALVPPLNVFLQHLAQHHRIEDHAYFPKFRELDQRLIVGFDLLEADHELIHQQLVLTVDNARELLKAVAGPVSGERHASDTLASRFEMLLTLLQEHLSDEEDLVIPALLEHGEQAL